MKREERFALFCVFFDTLNGMTYKSLSLDCQGDISQNVTSFTLISEYILSHNLTPPIRVFSVLATTSFSFINIYLALETSRNNAVVDLSESKTIEKRVIKESIFKICFGKKRFLDSS